MWRKLTSTLLVAAVIGLAAGASYAAPYNTKRIDDIPDFTQYDPALGLPNGGKYHCAVVAAANALVWLADRKGFKRLLPVRGVTVMDRVSSVVQSLSSEKYMATDPGFGEPGGTQTHRFLSGLERYLDDAGYRGRIRYQGIWPMPRKYAKRTGPVDLRWAARRFERGDAMWVGLRFYRDDGLGGLKPINGHMVTMVGYGVGPDGRNDANAIVIRDPSAGEDPYYLKIKARANGRIYTQSGKRLRDARGVAEVVAGYPVRKDVIVLLEKIIALEL
ncbi:MAG: hypothetical protein AAFQ73_09745 [Pseudomonadota bacterium]